MVRLQITCICIYITKRPGSEKYSRRPVLAYEPARTVPYATGLQPGVGRAQGGVPHEAQFLAGREDPHPVIGSRVLGRQQERGFGQVGPVGERLHLPAVQAFGVDDDGQRVAAQRFRGEDIELDKGPGPHGFGSHRCRLSPVLAGPDAVWESTGLAENKTSVGCLYLNNRLSEVDTAVLTKPGHAGHRYVMAEPHRP